MVSVSGRGGEDGSRAVHDAGMAGSNGRYMRLGMEGRHEAEGMEGRARWGSMEGSARLGMEGSHGGESTEGKAGSGGLGFRRADMAAGMAADTP